MKRKTKNWLLTAAALVLIGLLAFIGVLAANHWDFSAFGTKKLETNTLAIKDPFRSISISCDTEDIALCLSENGTCSVVFQEWENQRHSASVQDGTLVIEGTDSRKWYERIGFSLGSPTITLYLPQREYAALLVEGSTGEVTIPGDFSFESIRVSLSTGDVVCGAASAGPISVTTDTGDIRLENTAAGTLALSVSTGKVELSSVVCAGELGVTVSTGKAVLADVSCGSLVSNGSTGDISLKDVIAAEQIRIQRSTGDVKLERCDAAELDITTDTGDVTGSLLSEKVFIARSDTGRVEVPETTAGGKCKIVTDTGDIVIAVP